MQTLFWELWFKSATKVLGLFKLGKWRGHLPLFIGKVCGWLGERKSEVWSEMWSGSKHALDWLREAWNNRVLTLLTTQTTLSWSLATIWNNQRTWFDLLHILPFVILGNFWFYVWVKFWSLGCFGLQVDLQTHHNSICNMFGTIGIRFDCFGDLENGTAHSELDV